MLLRNAKKLCTSFTTGLNTRGVVGTIGKQSATFTTETGRKACGGDNGKARDWTQGAPRRQSADATRVNRL